MSCTATRHDTATAYQVDGCRCDAAKQAQYRYKKQWRRSKERGEPRNVDATGTRRRWQALMALGWPNHELMRRLGYSRVGNWIYYADSLHVDTVEKVTALYDELWDSRGPSKWTRTWARGQGFLLPMEWDDTLIDDPLHQPSANVVDDDLTSTVDEVALERFISGDLSWTALTTKERTAAAVLMDRRGVSRRHIAEATHLRSQTLWEAFRSADRVGVASEVAS